MTPYGNLNTYRLTDRAEEEIQIREDLRAAKKLISNPACWTKGAFARNADGDRVTPFGETATCFCATGAIRKVATSVNGFLRAEMFLLGVLMNEGGYSVEKFNDTVTHGEVLALFDKAIRQL